MSKIGRSGGSAAAKHKQFTSPSGAQEIFPVTAHGVIYGFLIEEPKDDPLFVLLRDKDSGDILMSFAAEGSKFGRDAQPFGMKFFPTGCDAELSTSRTATAAPTAGATLHIWYNSGANNS